MNQNDVIICALRARMHVLNAIDSYNRALEQIVNGQLSKSDQHYFFEQVARAGRQMLEANDELQNVAHETLNRVIEELDAPTTAIR